ATPPAANPTMIRTGREGYACALAIRDTAGRAAAPTARCRNCLRWGSFMAILPEIWSLWSLFRLDVGRPDHLGPFFCGIGHKLPKSGGRTGKCRIAEIGKPRAHFRVCQSRVHLLVELINDGGGRALA